MPAADRLIGRDAPDAAVFAEKVVMDKPDVKVVLHFLDALVSVSFGGALLDQAIGSLDHPIRLRRIGPGLAMLGLVVVAQLGKRMRAFGFGAPAIFESG